MRAFWADWAGSAPRPHVVVGHSMGGHLVLRALAEAAIAPDAAVLSAPMLGLKPEGVPTSITHATARLMIRIGADTRPAWKWSEKPGQMPAGRQSLLTHDDDRYADELWWREKRPEIVMGPGSWRWVERAIASIRGLDRAGTLERIETPVFIIATNIDALVSMKAIRRASARLPNAQLLEFGSEARHEILREIDPVRDRALNAIDAFLDRTAPRRT